METNNLATRDQVVGTVHSLHLSLADKCRNDHCISDEDIAVATVLAALDGATTYMDGDKDSGITWLRMALDVIEAGQPIMAETIQ